MYVPHTKMQKLQIWYAYIKQWWSEIFISFLLCVWSAQICSPRLDLFFNRKVFLYLTSFFYIRSIELITFFILFLNSYFVTMNLVVIFNNNGIAVRWICQILIMLYLPFRIGYPNMVGWHTRTSSGDPISGIRLPAHSRILWLSTIINILLHTPSLINCSCI